MADGFRPESGMPEKVWGGMSMIASIEPPVIAIMEPRESGPKAISDGFSN